jgi:hypothetical protein
MSRTTRRNDSDAGNGDGHIFVPATIENVAGSFVAANNIWTRNGSGNVGLLIPASTAAVLEFPLRNILFRYGLADDLQEAFGGSFGASANGLPIGSPFTLSTGSSVAGAGVSIAVLNSVGFTVGLPCLIDTVVSGVQETAIISAIPDGTHVQFANLKNPHTTPFPIQQNIFTTPANAGSPPFTGATQLTQTTSRPKGIGFKQIHAAYAIITNPLAVNTLGLTKTVFANLTAPVVTNILANAANGLQTAATTLATPALTPITVPLANQGFQNTRFSEYIVEWDITTPAGGTCQVFGFWLDVSYDWT